MKKGRGAPGTLWFILALIFLSTGCTVKIGLKQELQPLETRGTSPERTPLYHHDGWIIARASMHNHTIYSDGCRTPEDLLELARQQGMAILAYNDHREGRICTDERRLFCAQVGGVEEYGYDVYFNHLRQIQAEAARQNMIVLKGVEFFPFFFNYGRFPALVLDGLQHHFTVYGIEDPEILTGAPAAHFISLRPIPYPDETPWQDFVDYITNHGGIIHAVHVEEGADMWIGYAHAACPPPLANLHRLKRLTGFAILPSAWHERTGGPGGLWDTVLIEYLYGLRPAPLWAMADADYHCEASLAIATTLFYLREFTEEEVYRALQDGRMVALQGDVFQDSYVAEWWVSETESPAQRVMLGEEVRITGIPVVGFALDHPVPETEVRLIRNGRVIYETRSTTFIYRDEEQGARREPAFYRVEITGPVAEREPYAGPTMPASKLFTNPVFVRFEGAERVVR